MTVGLALRDLQPGSAHTRRQIFHTDLDLAIKAVATLHHDLKGTCLTRTKRHWFGKRSAVTVAKSHVDSPGRE